MGSLKNGNASRLTPLDDGFHHFTDDPWLTEGSWWCFFVPERCIDVWLYNVSRTNLGVVSGGCWAWDHTAHQCQEVLYYANYNCLPLPKEADLRNIQFPSGVRIETLEPLQKYRLSYSDGDLIQIDVVFEGVAAPCVNVTDEKGPAARFEQLCLVTGDMRLLGENFRINSLSLRDHSWSVRPERRERIDPRWTGHASELGRGPVGFFFGAESSRNAFLVSRLGSGYLIADGQRASIPFLENQSIERSDATGLLRRVTVSGRDEMGREFQAVGTAVNGMSMPMPGCHFAMCNYLMDWQFNGHRGWGEIQEVWPRPAWSSYRRWQIANFAR